MVGAGGAAAILLAAGQGERLGGDLPKQFLDLAGKPMFVHALRALQASPSISATVVVLPADRPAWVDAAVQGHGECFIAEGGPSRQSSLAQGMICLPGDCEVVAVHDAARPMIQPRLIEAVLAGLRPQVQGAIAALPMTDSVKEVSAESEVLRPLNRQSMWRAQTPQVFHRGTLEDALAQADAEGVITDDCSELLTRLGRKVIVVEGSPANFKVTLPADLAMAETILAGRSSLANGGRR